MDVREVPGGDFTRHPWEAARARFFVDLLAREGLLPDGIRALDVGAGDGYVAQQLLGRAGPGARVICFDAHYPDEVLTPDADEQRRGLSFTRERPSEAFQLILLLDVLEHVKDDRLLLSELVAELLDSGGHVLLSVPAWQSLFTRHDVVLGHCRRYRPRELRQVAQAAGLEVRRQGSLFTSLLPFRAAGKLGEVFRGVRSAPGHESAAAHADTGIADWSGGKLLTTLVLGGLDADAWVSRLASSLGMPWPGLSTWVIGRRA